MMRCPSSGFSFSYDHTHETAEYWQHIYIYWGAHPNEQKQTTTVQLIISAVLGFPSDEGVIVLGDFNADATAKKRGGVEANKTNANIPTPDQARHGTETKLIVAHQTNGRHSP